MATATKYSICDNHYFPQSCYSQIEEEMNSKPSYNYNFERIQKLTKLNLNEKKHALLTNEKLKKKKK